MTRVTSLMSDSAPSIVTVSTDGSTCATVVPGAVEPVTMNSALIFFCTMRSSVKVTVSGLASTSSKPCGRTVCTLTACLPSSTFERSTYALKSLSLAETKSERGPRTRSLTFDASFVIL